MNQSDMNLCPCNTMLEFHKTKNMKLNVFIYDLIQLGNEKKNEFLPISSINKLNKTLKILFLFII